MFPGYTAESSLGGALGAYRIRSSRSPSAGLRPAQSEVFCGVCALGGFGCGTKCHSCGPFGWFECCDSICTEPATVVTLPEIIIEV